MKCKECRWFESQRTETDSYDSKTGTWGIIEVGICRKYPPQRFVFPDDGNTSSGWPTTRSGDWCGEWEGSTPSTEIAIDDQIVQVLKNWRAAHGGMPMWKLRRSIQSREMELPTALERLVENGSLELVFLQTKGRPFSGCKLI